MENKEFETLKDYSNIYASEEKVEKSELSDYSKIYESKDIDE